MVIEHISELYSIEYNKKSYLGTKVISIHIYKLNSIEYNKKSYFVTKVIYTSILSRTNSRRSVQFMKYRSVTESIKYYVHQSTLHMIYTFCCCFRFEFILC